MKPDWKDAPEWANWLAMDANLNWRWHENKPSYIHWKNIWESEGRASLPSKASEFSLEKRPNSP